MWRTRWERAHPGLREDNGEKRLSLGSYQHCGDQHVQRYLAEFDFRADSCVDVGVNDDGRAERAIKDAVGKRMTYHQSGGHAAG